MITVVSVGACLVPVKIANHLITFDGHYRRFGYGQQNIASRLIGELVSLVCRLQRAT